MAEGSEVDPLLLPAAAPMPGFDCLKLEAEEEDVEAKTSLSPAAM